jgi:hypothetical protein
MQSAMQSAAPSFSARSDQAVIRVYDEVDENRRGLAGEHGQRRQRKRQLNQH